eukprot:scaffold200708_cov32-Tisochrysis_lutea.AAC.3
MVCGDVRPVSRVISRAILGRGHYAPCACQCGVLYLLSGEALGGAACRGVAVASRTGVFTIYSEHQYYCNIWSSEHSIVNCREAPSQVLKAAA